MATAQKKSTTSTAKAKASTKAKSATTRRKTTAAKKPAAKKTTTTPKSRKTSATKSALPKEVKGLFDDISKSKKKAVNIYNYKESPVEYNIVSTGRPSLDFVTNGGLKDYGFAVFGGSESSGKTSGAFQAGQELALSKGKRIAYLDSEFTMDNAYLEAMGVDPSIVDVYETLTLEDMCDILVDHIIPSEIYAVIIWDSPSNMASAEELKKEAAQKTMATAARIMGTQVKRFNFLLKQHRTLLIAIYHVSMNMDRKTPYDDLYVISGGKRKDHNSILTLFFQAMKKSYGDNNVYNYKQILGRAVKVAALKCKYGPPLRTATLFMEFGKGYSVVNDVYFLGVEFGIIEGKTRKTFEGEILGNGQANSIRFLKENPEMVEAIRGKIQEHYVAQGHVYTTDSDLTGFLDPAEVRAFDRENRDKKRSTRRLPEPDDTQIKSSRNTRRGRDESE